MSARSSASGSSRFALVITLVLVLVVGVIGASLLLTRPAPGSAAPVEGLVTSDTRLLGEPGDSGVEFVVFGDFQCPGCAAAAPHIDELRTAFRGEVTFAFRNFPLSGHAHAVDAALVAEAAGRQGRFAEMHDLLYARQSVWSQSANPMDEFRSYAAQLGLQLDRFDADVASEEVLAHVTADRAFAEQLGLRGTPSFFVDGTQLSLQSYDDLRTAIVEALRE